MPRGGDIPEGLEILDDAGRVIAAGEVAPAEPIEADVDERPPRRPRPLWIAIGLIGLAGVALAALLITDDGDPAPAAPDPIGILDGPAVTAEGLRPATFPLLGRSWDHDLVTSLNGDVVVIDLNTGDRRVAGRGAERFGSQIAVVDGEIYLSDFEEVQRLTGGEPETIVEDSTGTSFIIGSYAQTQARLFSGEPTFTHLVTGEEISLDATARYTVVGDHIFFERGGHIGLVDRDGASRAWARGELLLSGDGAVAWRSCSDLDDCDYWSGTPDDPRRLRLDPPTAATALLLSSPSGAGSTTFLGQISLLSPTGRHGWSITSTGATFEFEIQLVDLQSGAFVEWPDALNQPLWWPDESAILMSEGDSVMVFDTATGDGVRIPSEGPTFGGGIALLPRE